MDQVALIQCVSVHFIRIWSSRFKLRPREGIYWLHISRLSSWSAVQPSKCPTLPWLLWSVSSFRQSPYKTRSSFWGADDRPYRVQTVDNHRQINSWNQSTVCCNSKGASTWLHSKQQSRFLQERKETITPGVVLIIGDCAEKYSFVVKDAAQ